MLPSVPPQVNALMQGDRLGKMKLQGLAPSATNVGGAPPTANDPAAFCFDMAFKALSKLADELHNMRQARDANMVAKQAVQLQHLALERRKRLAENAQSPTSSPYVPNQAAGNG